MEPSIVRFLQEGAELLHQQSNILDRLMQYLDDTLMTLNSKLNPDNFNRILDVMWVKLTLILTRMVENGIEVNWNTVEESHSSLHVLMLKCVDDFRNEDLQATLRTCIKRCTFLSASLD